MSSIVFPSQNTWITPRTNGVLLDSNNCQIILNQKIEKIDKVYLNAKNICFARTQLQMVDSGTTVTDTSRQYLSDFYYDKELTKPVESADITRWIVEEATWKLLPSLNTFNNDGKLYKNNTFLYGHNSNTIELPNDRIGSWLLDDTIYINILQSLRLYLPDLYIYHQSLTTRGVAKLTSYVVETLRNNIMSAQFRVYYTPLGESVKLQVPKTNPQPRAFCIPYSQQQPIVDNVSLGREMQSVANRTGCVKHQIVRTLNDFKDIRRPRDHWFYREKDANGNLTGNVWRLTEVHIEIWHEHLIQVLETWSKNWSYRSEHVPINREFRSWNIPADIVQRNVMYQDYCLITTKDVQLPQDAIFSKEAQQELLRGLENSFNSEQSTECTNMWFATNTPSFKGAVLSCSAFGFGNSLVFSGKTKDNLSAGVQRVPSETGDTNYQFCKDVYYCNDDGKLDEMWVQIASEVNAGIADAAYKYPEVSSDMNTPSGLLLFNYQTQPSSSLFYAIFELLKDPAEQINFTYQLHLLTDNGFLVIGATWAATNPLVKERKQTTPVKVWKLSQYVPAGAQIMTNIYGSVYEGNAQDLFVVDRTAGTITFKPVSDGVGVCVTDEYNNVLIAYNNADGATFNMAYTHNYKAVYQASRQQ